jgi:hypothetical protein
MKLYTLIIQRSLPKRVGHNYNIRCQVTLSECNHIADPGNVSILHATLPTPSPSMPIALQTPTHMICLLGPVYVLQLITLYCSHCYKDKSLILLMMMMTDSRTRPRFCTIQSGTDLRDLMTRSILSGGWLLCRLNVWSCTLVILVTAGRSR